MKPAIRCSSTFSLLILLPTLVSSFVVPTLPAASDYTLSPALAQQQVALTTPFWPVSTYATIVESGVTTEVPIYDCPTDASQPPRATLSSGSLGDEWSYAASKTLYPCVPFHEKKSALSTGAIAGIAIGVSIPILAGVAFIFYRLWSKSQKEKAGRKDDFNFGVRKPIGFSRGPAPVSRDNKTPLPKSIPIQVPTPVHKKQKGSIGGQSMVPIEVDGEKEVRGRVPTKGGVVTQISAGIDESS